MTPRGDKLQKPVTPSGEPVMVSLRLDRELVERLESLARATRRTRTDVMARLLAAGLEVQEKA